MIEVAALSYRYPRAASAAIEGLGFSVKPGEIFGFLGPSGAGKSTTLKILTGLLRGYEGEARVLGQACGKGGGALRARIGVAFETPGFFSRLTGLENLEYFGSLYPRAGDPRLLLERLGLGAEAGKRVGAWSKGMKARLNLARALLHEPEVLFLDEPTSGLDPSNARNAAELVRERARAGATVFLTTHSMQLAEELCDTVAFLCGGRIAAMGGPRALRLEHGRRAVRVERAGPAGPEAAEFPLDGLGADEAFRAFLAGGRVETLHSAEASLADIFVALTGRSLE